MRALLIIAGSAMMAGCGPSYIVLEISTGNYVDNEFVVDNTLLTIPDDIDTLRVVTLKTNAEELLDQEYELTPGLAFPIEVLLVPRDDTPDNIAQRVTALRGDLVRASTKNDRPHDWKPHHDTYVDIEMLVFPTP